jgi:hypothetical protein
MATTTSITSLSRRGLLKMAGGALIVSVAPRATEDGRRRADRVCRAAGY